MHNIKIKDIGIFRGGFVKRLCLSCMLLFFALSLSCCSKKDAAANISDIYSGDIVCTASIQTVSETACDYIISFSRQNGTDSIEILSPQSIQGIKATVQKGSAGISYEGKYLETLLPYYWGASPIDALSALFDDISLSEPQWKNISDKTIEAEYYTSSDNADLYKKTVFDKNTLALKNAEIELDGVMIMKINITSLQTYGKSR